MLPDKVIEQIYGLNVGIIGRGVNRHERPHKPLLLLAIIALLEEGRANPSEILWSQDLRTQFARYFEVVRQRDDKNTPENPFLYLRKDGFWIPYERDERGIPHRLDATPSVADATAGRVYAKFTRNG